MNFSYDNISILISFIIGVYFFLHSFEIIKITPKNETQRERQLVYKKKFGKLMKICSVILIFSSLIQFIFNKKSPSEEKKLVNNWTLADKEAIIKTCIRDSGKMGQENLVLTKEYCECSANNVVSAFKKEDYIKNLSKSKEEQIEILMPIIIECKKVLDSKIEESNKSHDKIQ
jgi:uncharacterized membrane protein